MLNFILRGVVDIVIEKILNYGENFCIEDIKKKDNKNIIYIKSNTSNCKCPKCKKISSKKHSTYKRKIQDTPIQNIETWLVVNAYEYECINEECEVTTFNESLPFAIKNKVMTNNLIQFILSISIFMSSSATSLILSFLGVKVSADTIDRIIQKIEIVDNPDIEEVGIDDVAIRKGQTYATAIYDLNDHHLLALLEGRDADSIRDWLTKHPKIKTVARDRASAYATVISEVLPNCMQVADRFHLFQNLIEYLKDIFYKEIPEKIFIKNNQIEDGSNIKKVPIKVNIDNEKLKKLDYDNSQPIDKDGNIICFNKELLNKNSNVFQKHQKKRDEKRDKIKKIRERAKEEFCHKKIMDEFNVSRNTLKKYLKMTDEEVENISFVNVTKENRVLDEFTNMIYKMLLNQVSLEYIIEYTIQKGYLGSVGTLKGYILSLIKNNHLSYNCSSLIFDKYAYPDDVIVINRLELLKNILTIDEKKKSNEIEKHINLIKVKYPIVKEVQNIFCDFHQVMFGNNPNELDIFIEKYNLKINSFCNGLKKDIAPVKNAISNEINSGFVEGNNNKFKLIKRIVYGKQKLVNLFKRSYLCFLATLDNFSIQEIVNQVLEN